MYDTTIIGAGPGGYLAAERLAKSGKKVLLVEKNFLGGTCLNEGCMPTKTLINAAKLYVHAGESGKFGVTCGEVSFDWGKMQAWKQEVVDKLKNGIALTLRKNFVDIQDGTGSIIKEPGTDSPGLVRVELTGGGFQEQETKTIIISTGSRTFIPPIPGSRDNPNVLDSSVLLAIRDVPKSLTIIGGGVIGTEFAGLFSALGCQVTVIEMMDEIIPLMDREQAPLLRRNLRQVDFKLGCRVDRIENTSVYFTAKDGSQASVTSDIILMAVGRKPLTDGFGLENTSVTRGQSGIAVDEYMKTSSPFIWAVGDCTGKSLLAHSAHRMAEVASTDILKTLGSTPGENRNRMSYQAIPWVVYGISEAAGVGMTEQDAEKQNIPIVKSSVPMRMSGRFAAENTFAGQGAVKIIAQAETKRILGIHAVGAYASEFIWGAGLIIEQGFTVEDVKKMIFPHPTVCELIKEAVWSL